MRTTLGRTQGADLGQAGRWALTLGVAFGVGICAAVAGLILWGSSLSEALNLAPIQTQVGAIQPPRLVPAMPPYLWTAVALGVLGSVSLALIALGLRRALGGSTMAALVAVSAGPLIVLALAVGLTFYGYTQDPPEASVDTLYGLSARGSLGLLLLYVVPPAIAWIVLGLTGRGPGAPDEVSASTTQSPPPSA